MGHSYGDSILFTQDIFEYTWYVRRLCSKVLSKQIWIQALSCRFLLCEIHLVQASGIRTLHNFVVIFIRPNLQWVACHPSAKWWISPLSVNVMSSLDTPKDIFLLFILKSTQICKKGCKKHIALKDCWNLPLLFLMKHYAVPTSHDIQLIIIAEK